MKNKNVVHVVWALGSGGAERFVVDLANNSCAKGQVTILCLRSIQQESASFFKSLINDEVKVESLGTRQGFTPVLYFRALFYMLKNRPDVVHFHIESLQYFYLSIWLKLFGIRFIHTIHTSAEQMQILSFEKMVFRLLYSFRIVHPVTISKQSDISFERFFGDYDRITIFNGRSKFTKQNLLESEHRIIHEIRSKYEILFVHVGRYHQAKNQHVLLDVFSRLKQKRNVGLIILGTGFEDDFKSMADSNVHFIGETKNVGAYLEMADAFCLTSLWEGLPISLLEAMSVGCVPICTPAGGIIDVICDGQTGFLSDGFTVNAYFAAVVRYIDKKAHIEKERIIAEYSKKYDISHTVKKYQLIYGF